MDSTNLPMGRLNRLNTVDLKPNHRRLLETALADNNGPPAWRLRKQAEAHELLALAQISGRFSVHRLDLATSLRALLVMTTPVPCLPASGGPLRIIRHAVLGIIYSEEAMRLPQPGYRFVQVLQPTHVYHPHVAAGSNQLFCLGATPAGIRLREVVMSAYAGLTFQAVDLQNLSAGVMNPDALHYWTENIRQIPLTQEPFVQPEGIAL
jgi:hypothetical protein